MAGGRLRHSGGTRQLLSRFLLHLALGGARLHEDVVQATEMGSFWEAHQNLLLKLQREFAPFCEGRCDRTDHCTVACGGGRRCDPTPPPASSPETVARLGCGMFVEAYHADAPPGATLGDVCPVQCAPSPIMAYLVRRGGGAAQASHFAASRPASGRRSPGARERPAAD
jgi:hypothetical protein